MTDGQRTGRCLCGAVTFRAMPKPRVEACHCEMCRRWGGTAFMVVDCGTAVAFEGGPIARYRSSDWAERGFCPACGTHLFYYFMPAGSYSMPVGAFDDQTELSFEREIYIDRKPDCYAFAGERKRLTEAEFLASVGVSGES